MAPGPPRKWTWLRLLGRYCFLAAGCYLGVLLVLMALENWLVFRPTSAADNWESPPAAEVRDIQLTTSQGIPIHAWWWPAPDLPFDKGENRRGAVLYCHGNAGNLSSRGPTLSKIRQALGEAILIFDYPGYGKSGGKPSEKGCYQAADAAHDWLVNQQKIDPERIIIYGGSLGGGVAVDLASRKKHRALVLAKTFTSIPDVAQRMYFWLPVRWLMRNRFDNLGKIGLCRQPVFLVHGTADSLVPFDHAKRLFAAANEPKQLFPVQAGDHNDPLPLEFFQKLQDFLVDLDNQQPSRPATAKN